MLPLELEGFTSVSSYRMDEAALYIKLQQHLFSASAVVSTACIRGKLTPVRVTLHTCITLADSGAAYEALCPHRKVLQGCRRVSAGQR